MWRGGLRRVYERDGCIKKGCLVYDIQRYIWQDSVGIGSREHVCIFTELLQERKCILLCIIP